VTLAVAAGVPVARDLVVLGQVVVEGVAEQRPGLRAQRADVGHHVDERAVLAQPLGAQRHRTAGADPLQHRVLLGHQVVGDDRRPSAHQLCRVPPEQPLRGRVPGENHQVAVERDDRVGRARDNGAGDALLVGALDLLVTHVPHRACCGCLIMPLFRG